MSACAFLGGIVLLLTGLLTTRRTVIAMWLPPNDSLSPVAEHLNA